ncbi:MAG: hypothetical protein JXA82_04685 [Sedimentisphaerales bacterium]|nr:hypothetical protein [Sedimentisphaerales bacterium]
MKIRSMTLLLLIMIALVGGVKAFCREVDGVYELENAYLKRTFNVKNGILCTCLIVNKSARTTEQPIACDEFRLRISEGTHTIGKDVVLTAADFDVGAIRREKESLLFDLENTERRLKITVCYHLKGDEPWLRKQLTISGGRDFCLERIDVDVMTLEDVYQPYTLKRITAYAPGQWKPGLGQPLYTRESGMFWGVEFPAAVNFVEGKTLYCGYLRGRTIKAGDKYTTHSAVHGVGDSPAHIQDAFFDYIHAVRVRPLRLQIQYNSWFDYGEGVNRENFQQSVRKIHDELVVKRENRPLRAYVIDDGWEDTRADWSDKVWKVNSKFDVDFDSVQKTVTACDSRLGLWLSPGCLFGARSAIPSLRKLGWEAMDDWMSMAGPKYMGMFEKRMVELTGMGMAYFKLDGLFGHLNLRNFELQGDRYGLPVMPQLGLEGIKSGDEVLNDSKYDELKLYYLSAGTERLMEMFGKMAVVNPDVYIVISNGAYLSPWWLQYVDSVWMINAGDAAGGADRTAELVYRDGRYYEIYAQENTQFPMCALFNHEPKKVKANESKDSFRRYLYMNISRGTGFIELYIKTFNLKDYDWDVLSEGLHWAYSVFPTFHRSRMHGGSPQDGEIYGYTAWTQDQGYVSVHNPSSEEKTYSFVLDRSFGLMPDSGTFFVSSPIADCMKGLAEKYCEEDIVTVRLQPREIRILNFDKVRRDWTILRELQVRTAADYEPPEPVRLTGHVLLGVWEYTFGGDHYSREFTADGHCVLRHGETVVWKKRCTSVSKTGIVVEDAYSHNLGEDGILVIEGRYHARKK